MPRMSRFQHEARSRVTRSSHRTVAHGGRIPSAGRGLPRRPEAAYRPGAPEAAYRPGAPVAGNRHWAPSA